jgi:hypothetical protein
MVLERCSNWREGRPPQVLPIKDLKKYTEELAVRLRTINSEEGVTTAALSVSSRA